MKAIRTYSGYVRQALQLLGADIQVARKTQGITTIELCQRCGFSRPTLRNIERGDPKVEIGMYFEAAAVVGIRLFNSESRKSLAYDMKERVERLTLLPERVRPKKRKRLNNDF